MINQESGHTLLQNFGKSATNPLIFVLPKIITPKVSDSLDTVLNGQAKQKKARIDCNSVPLFSSTLRRMCYNMQKKADIDCSLVPMFYPALNKKCYRQSKQKKADLNCSMVPLFSPTLKRMCHSNTRQKKAGIDCSKVPRFSSVLRKMCLSAVRNQNGQWARHRQRRMQNIRE